MASIETRALKSGTVYWVRWRVGGRGTSSPGERFTDIREAEKFKADFEFHGNQYPPNYLPGVGYVTEAQMAAYRAAYAQPPATTADAPEPVLFEAFALDYVANRSGIDDRTKKDYERDIRKHMIQFFGMADVRDEQGITNDAVAAWVNSLEGGVPDPECAEDWIRAPLKPKTIANLHGLLYAILAKAVEAKLRASNPCDGTTLPRKNGAVFDEDDDEDHEGDVMVLDYAEFAVIYALAPEPLKDLLLAFVGTGLRFGELTALKVRDVYLDTPAPYIRVRRAWKRTADYTFVLGPPKSEAGIRNVPLGRSQVAMFARLIKGRSRNDFVLTNPSGEVWRHANFHNRYWQPLIYRAVRCEKHRLEDYVAGCRWRRKLTKQWLKPCGCAGTLSKTPTVHVLRHTCVSWLLAKNVPLSAIQKRVGHESYATTDRVYGHLVPELDRRQADAMDDALDVATGAQTPNLALVV